MKLRIMAQVKPPFSKADALQLIGSKETLKQDVGTAKDKDDKNVVAVDVVMEEDADAQALWMELKKKVMTTGSHIHQCFHSEYTGKPNQPCVVVEEVA